MFMTRRATVLDNAGQPKYLIKTREDITERREAELKMAHMAYHDALTNLPNRASFLKSLTQLIDACTDNRDAFAVLSVDLNGLKEVNDVFGHVIGDKLLIEVARRMDIAATGLRSGASSAATSSVSSSSARSPKRAWRLPSA